MDIKLTPAQEKLIAALRAAPGTDAKTTSGISAIRPLPTR